MIAGRTRFYLVAGIVGAIVGEALGAVLAIGAARLLPDRSAALMSLLLLLLSGTVAGAYAGVVLMRAWYRREAERKQRFVGDVRTKPRL